VQAAKAPVSRAHSKLDPSSPAEKWKLALALLLRAGGPVSMLVCGAVVSTVHAWVAAVASVLPAGSVARTWKVCEPSLTAAYSAGLVQAVKAASSRVHSKLESSSPAEKWKLASAPLVRAGGPALMLVCGEVVSTVHV
jgi:hypothetical protein